VEARTDASIAHIGSLFRIDPPDPAPVSDLYLALLTHGILLTPRGMGCLSTPMTRAGTDAFAEAVALSFAVIG
jgi:hypothetical protein